MGKEIEHLSGNADMPFLAPDDEGVITRVFPAVECAQLDERDLFAQPPKLETLTFTDAVRNALAEFRNLDPEAGVIAVRPVISRPTDFKTLLISTVIVAGDVINQWRM